jgi:hypothetical protein
MPGCTICDLGVYLVTAKDREGLGMLAQLRQVIFLQEPGPDGLQP